MKPDIKKETPRVVELVEVIRVEAARGQGTEEDPVRVVNRYWSKVGTLLAEKDEY